MAGCTATAVVARVEVEGAPDGAVAGGGRGITGVGGAGSGAEAVSGSEGRVRARLRRGGESGASSSALAVDLRGDGCFSVGWTAMDD